VATVEEYQRFTLVDVNSGAARGWKFAGGSWRWFTGGWWAWFTREVEDDG
jgi:hypothetical protein